MTLFSRFLTLLVAAALAAFTGIVAAQPYPQKPVRLIVPYAPGGTTDILARTIAQELGKRLGQQVVVENKPGAGTLIGAEATARSAPDGYTIMMATSTTLAINPSLYSKLPYDPVKDFAPVTLTATIPLVVVVNPAVPARSIQELVALAKSKPASLSYGSAGNGSPQHLGAELFKSIAGIDMVHVPYKGTAPALTDLLGGRIQVMFSDIAPALPHIRAGKLRALAVTTSKQVSALSDLPTVAESGVPGYEAAAWQSVVAPAGTPKEIVARLNAEIVQIMGLPDVREHLSGVGALPASSSPEQLGALIKSEIARWADIVKHSGAKVD